jgi:predicted permease
MRFLEDVRYAGRTLYRSPGFLLLAMFTLGLGMSASTAVFSLFYQVILKSLPVSAPERLAILHAEGFAFPGRRSSDNSDTVFSYPLYRYVRDHSSRAFSGLAARSAATLLFRSNSASDQLLAEVVTGNFFDVLGVAPQLGRLLHAADESAPGANPVLVLSFQAWMQRFGGSPAALNQTVNLNGRAFTVVGVAPQNFRGLLSGNAPEIFVPISMNPVLMPDETDYDSPSFQKLTIFGRLSPGVSFRQAKAQLEPVFAAVVRDHLTQLKVTREIARQRLMSIPLEPRPAAKGLNELERQWRKPLFVLMAMVGMLLLIGCANLANLLLARGAGRSRETAIRLAVGASSWRVISPLFAESLLVAIGGAAMGVLFTPLLTRGVLSLLPSDAVAGWVRPTVSLPVIGFAMLIMIVTGVLSGIAPAFQAVRTGAASVLGDRSAGSGSGHLSPRLRQALVAAQAALSLVLLCSAGLFGNSFRNLLTHQPGFRTENLVTFRIDAGTAGFAREQGLNLYHQLELRLEAMPRAESVAVAETSPLSGSESMTNVSIESYMPAEGENMDSDTNAVGPGFFATLGTPIIGGREFTERDRSGAAKVAVVNEAFAKRFFQGRSPVGRRMKIGSGGSLDIEIVGEVANMQNMSLKEPAKPCYFIPFEQANATSARLSTATYFVRSPAAEEALVSSARAAVSQLGPEIPVMHLETMQTKVNNNVATDRLLAALATACGLLALALTAIGLYGVIAYVVTRRTAEIGIRMALGADRARIVSLILREVLVVAGSGAIIGMFGAWGAERAVSSQLFGMSGSTNWLPIAATVILGAVALGAGALPAWRAARIEPLDALRHE